MRSLFLAAAALVVASLAGSDALAQQRPQEDAAAKAKKRKEWETPQARLDGDLNDGPCPFVKVLYDAGRYVELEGARESASAVKWSGEIQGVEASCRYKGDEPITLDVDVLFSLGRGPKADAQTKQYRWWVAVTQRNREVLAKEYFALNAEFQPGRDRLTASERLGGITIPRRDKDVSGANFEVLIGFDVTPEMAAFNRDGKRFRVDAGQTAAAGTSQSTTR
jgi:hypothetical protein